MEQTDIRELRKVIKAKDSVIDWVYGVYVDAENNVCYEDLMRLSDMEEAEKFRHLNIFAKILSPRIGMETFPVRLNGQQEDLLGLRSSAEKSIDTFEAFRDQLTSSYEHTDPYYAVLVRVVYDVPTKAADRRTLAVCITAAFVIGIYDGFYGPGTGTFLIIVFTVFARMTVESSNAQAKVINLTTNITSLTVFLLNGQVLFPLGLAGALCNMAGNWVGSGLAITKGTKIVRPVILLVLLLLLAKILFNF
jgi:hypothetical protein